MEAQTLRLLRRPVKYLMSVECFPKPYKASASSARYRVSEGSVSLRAEQCVSPMVCHHPACLPRGKEVPLCMRRFWKLANFRATKKRTAHPLPPAPSQSPEAECNCPLTSRVWITKASWILLCVKWSNFLRLTFFPNIIEGQFTTDPKRRQRECQNTFPGPRTSTFGRLEFCNFPRISETPKRQGERALLGNVDLDGVGSMRRANGTWVGRRPTF